MSLSKFLKVCALVVGFFVLSVPLWLNVDKLPLRMWDEARNAVNALEMLHTANPTVRTYHWQPETYELKPPLLTWLQVASFKLVGENELGVRLPSVLASIGTLFLVFLFVYSITHSSLFSFLGAGIVSTSAGFYGEHVGRYGDHDALLVFCSTAFVLAIFLYTNTHLCRYIYIAGMAIALGVLTKSVAILMMVPGVFIYLLLTKEVLPILKSKHFYIALVAAVLPLLLYYYLRETEQPGYLELVWQGELLPRYLNNSKDYTFLKGGPWYYTSLLFNSQMSIWLWFLPLAMLTPTFSRQSRKPWFFTITISLIFIIILSRGSKNFWYDAPIIPILSVLISLSFFYLFSLTKQKEYWAIIPVLILLVLPYRSTYSSSLTITEKYYSWETNGISYYLREPNKADKLSNSIKILLDAEYGLEPHNFYVEKLTLDKNIDLKRTFLDKIQLGDTLLIAHKCVFEKLEKKYAVHVLDSMYKSTKLLIIKDKM